MQKPNTFGSGVSGSTGAADQSIAAGKNSVGTSFMNQYGDRYVAVIVKCTKAYSIYLYGNRSNVPWSSTADVVGSTAVAIDSSTGNALTANEGRVHYFPCAGFKQVLPVLVNNDGAVAATVTLTYQTFND